jgi:hypothetical protein
MRANRLGLYAAGLQPTRVAQGTACFVGGYPFVNVIAKIVLASLLMVSAMRAADSAPQDDPKACSDSVRNTTDQNLSEKLDKTNGVICPPSVDPAINAPTPPSGTMPVIPPPGSPGGDPTVQPK